MDLLSLLKLDLGITHSLRDAYFLNLIDSSKSEIEATGVILDMLTSDDQMLVVDYAAWTYRKRQEDVPLSKNLMFRIKNRMVKKAGSVEDAVN